PLPVVQAANGAYGSAHNGFFVSPDGSENWLVYHATTNPAGSCWTDRTTRIQPFTWNEDGTPQFGAPLPRDADIPVPSGERAYGGVILRVTSLESIQRGNVSRR